MRARHRSPKACGGAVEHRARGGGVHHHPHNAIKHTGEGDKAKLHAARRKRGGSCWYCGQGMEDGRKRGGKLTAHQRQSLPKSDFALPGKGTGPKGAGSGSYPIPDESHARNALARSSGKPVHAAVVRKVKAKFPGIKVSS